MSNLRPIFEDEQATYVADTCQALARGIETDQVQLHALARGHYPGHKLPRAALSGVRTVGYWDAIHDQDWGLDWHRNEGIELTLLETGHLGFSVGGPAHELQAGDLTITRPWQAHCVGMPHVRASRLHWLILDVNVRRPHQRWRWPSWIVLSRSDRDELTDMLRHNEHPVWPGGPEILACFQKIASAVESTASGSSVSRLAVLINELLLLTLEMLRRADPSLDRALSKTQRTVELLLADLQEAPQQLVQDWTVRKMANCCGLGVTQFSSHCKQLTNMSPLQYLNHLRLERAARLLVEHPDLAITEVTHQCGFASSQYFATAFRRRFGVAPREYRNSAAAKSPPTST
ncbi:AraC family transcriptional regulator [Novipirellula artificiosorum]|uniref:HTH-type transcriptional activator RhaS n=1 Tax=Novipirellula artificiosorum TaxID=2528016 RepID=A0A5C6DUB6_9BACT|nr:AraC family transcriptional regulator [Novipirellula artificiosorum]TWU40973.1 HTH-type transcriptional activator RhaS [Novipirellula artificiosorum]